MLAEYLETHNLFYTWSTELGQCISTVILNLRKGTKSCFFLIADWTIAQQPSQLPDLSPTDDRFYLQKKLNIKVLLTITN